eukprot:TRINITY_DN19536_c0_g2_i1.p1 TRINITY_DN19536_c0_g2~~TRINITY_DN19536_c0_g2_i1.p1  ORF type:complete len:64 (-),score=15.03 TRINITY_DN19536_c0_g2_i1:74-265(-)
MNFTYFYTLVLAAIFAFFTPGVDAYYFGWGDGITLTLAIILGIVVFCAILGLVSRKLNGTSGM